jgi:ABC-type Fe3+ transport system permease subunit
MSGSQPKGLEKPTRRELLLLTVPVLLLPLVVVGLGYLFLTAKDFEDIPIGKRILLLPVALVLFPCALFVVLYGHVLRPMFQRIRRRREALIEAGRALDELVRTIPGIRLKGTER